MIPLSLPQEDRRTVLRSFWFLISLSAGLVLSLVCWIFITPPWAWASGLVVLLVLAPLAFSQEHLVRRLYHAWNNRIVRRLSSAATAITLRICLLLVFAATGRAGSRLQIRGLSGTMWVKRSAATNHTTGVPFASAADVASVPNGWIRNYLRWAFQSQNFWAICLIPFLCFLRMVSAEEETSSGSNIYTLF
jgi:hypothetical protein